jgi:hypothetical protein
MEIERAVKLKRNPNKEEPLWGGRVLAPALPPNESVLHVKANQIVTRDCGSHPQRCGTLCFPMGEYFGILERRIKGTLDSRLFRGHGNFEPGGPCEGGEAAWLRRSSPQMWCIVFYDRGIH